MKKKTMKRARPPGAWDYVLNTYDRHGRDDEILAAVGREFCDGSGTDFVSGYRDMAFAFAKRGEAMRAARRVKKIRGVSVRLVGEIKIT